MASKASHVITYTKTYEQAVELQTLLDHRFINELGEKNSWGIQSAQVMEQSGFAVVLVGQSQEPLRVRMGDYLAGYAAALSGDE